MAKETITDGMSALNVLTNINANFTELYTYGFFSEVIARSSGSPSSGDPAGLSQITHSISGYTNAPKVILVLKSPWLCSISSISNTTIVIDVSGIGSGTTLDYDLLVISTDV